jgi:putative DNA primase/helicase
MGALLAGRFALESVPEGYVMTLEDAKVWLENFRVEEISTDGRDANDEKKCLSHLLNSKLQMDGGKQRTVGELIGVVIHEPNSEQVEFAATQQESDESMARAVEKTISRAALNRSGIEVANGLLIVADSHPTLAGIFRGTAWHKGHSRFLKRLPESDKRTTHRFVTGSGAEHATKIPLKVILK